MPIFNEETLKTMRVIDNHNYDIDSKLLKPYRNSERLVLEQNQQQVIKRSDNTFLLTLFWMKDLVSYPPHFHIVDFETLGEKINSAYTLIDGKYFHHGSCIAPLNDNDLQLLNESFSIYSWNDFIDQWKLDTYLNLCKGEVCKQPVFTNTKYDGLIETMNEAYNRFKGKELYTLSWTTFFDLDDMKQFEIGIYQDEINISHPHFHVIDKETHGEVSNFAFRFKDGKLIHHKQQKHKLSGNIILMNEHCRTSPTCNEITLIQKFLLRSRVFNDLKKYWIDYYSRKNLRKKTRIPKLKIY